ncbi:MAG: hypothetical protein NC124_02220 [Clostridium sp.]|nr:hypothetical protein [Clostridium sp.]
MQGLNLILTALAVQFFLISYANGLGGMNIQYELYVLNAYIMSMIMGIGWFQSVDYSQSKLKTLILFEILFFLTEIISFGLSFTPIGNSFSVVKAFGLTAWLYYILYRSLKAPKAKINDKDIFAVRTKPNDFQGLILSMIGIYPLGSYGLLYKNTYYHYSHGKMVKSDVKALLKNKDKFVVIKAKKYNSQTIEEIEKLVGSKWPFRNNCFTKIRPLLK